MDSHDIYYTENSEWIDNTVLIDNNELTWQEDGPEITIDYSEPDNTLNKTLTENDSYLTANDTNETSQYFSILNSTEDEYVMEDDAKYILKIPVDKEEIILPDSAKVLEEEEVTEDIQKVELEPEPEPVPNFDQVLLYQMEGSDNLFAMQIADDGNGNFQKYKYQVRQNDNGQLEAVPGTIEIQESDEMSALLCNLEKSPESVAETTIETELFYSNLENLDNEIHINEETLELTEEQNSNLSESEYEMEELEDAFRDDIDEKEIFIESQIILQHKTNNIITKSPEPKKVIKIEKSNFVKIKEKENVSLVQPKHHYRSILKTNLNKSEEKPAVTSNPVITPVNQDPLLSDAPMLSKAARQPRKQIIVPIDRGGSEIVVTPMVFYSSLDDQTVIAKDQRKKFLESQIVVVSDDDSDESDPDFTLKPKKKVFKRHSKRSQFDHNEITILDSDEESVIEVSGSDEEQDKQEDSENVDTIPKKRLLKFDGEKITIDEQPVVEEVTNTTETSAKPTEKSVNIKDESQSLKKNHKCSLCPKTFPNVIALKKHIVIHSVRKGLRSRLNNDISKIVKRKESERSAIGTRTTTINNKENKKFHCIKCKLTFLTENQFKRHQAIHIVKRKLSPQKILTTKTTATKSKKPEKFRCEYCSQHFAEKKVYLVHRNSHKTFPCPNCKITFTAKILLDEHFRKNCVKTPTNCVCPKCSKRFPSMKSLQMHINVLHKMKLKPEITKYSGVIMSTKLRQSLKKIKPKI